MAPRPGYTSRVRTRRPSRVGCRVVQRGQPVDAAPQRPRRRKGRRLVRQPLWPLGAVAAVSWFHSVRTGEIVTDVGGAPRRDVRQVSNRQGDRKAARRRPGTGWGASAALRISTPGARWFGTLWAAADGCPAAALPSAQAYQGADCKVGAQDEGDVGHELPGVAQQPVLGGLESRLGGFRPDLQEHEGNDDQQEID